MELWGCFVVAAVSCELFYGNAWRFQLESGRQCLDTQNIPSIWVWEVRVARRMGHTPKPAFSRGRNRSSSHLCFPQSMLPNLTSSLSKWCFPAPDVMAEREIQEWHWVCPELWLSHFREGGLESLWVHPGVCFRLFWADLAPPFTVCVCKPILVGCLNSVCWNLFKLPVNLWIVLLCMIQNAAESFQTSPLSPGSHSELRSLKKLRAQWACSGCCIGINLCSSYELQFHLLRTPEVIAQLEVKITVHPYSWLKRVKKANAFFFPKQQLFLQVVAWKVC